MTVQRASWPIALALMLCASTATNLHADLVGWWTFDDVVGLNVPDSSGFGNDGSLINGATVSSDVPAFLGGGQSLILNGADQYVLVPHDTSLDITTAMTISAWIKPTGNVAWDGIVAKSPSDGSAINHAGNYELRVENSTRQITLHHQNGGVDDTASYTTLGPVVTDSVWQHVAITATAGGSLNYYLNGLLTNSEALPSTFGVTNTNPLYIGNRADLFTDMDGLIDDLRIYDEALSDQQIADLVGATIVVPPPPAGLISATIFSVSSNLVGFDRPAVALVNGSGLNSANGTHSINPDGTPDPGDGTMWLNQGTFGGGEPDLPADAHVTFDMGQVTSLASMRIWNYNEAANDVCCLARGIATMDVLVSDNGVDFTLFIPGQSLDIAPGSTVVDFSQTIPLNGVAARYVKFANMANYGDANNFVGLSEVQFFAVPEPSSLALVVFGLAGLAFRSRRRRMGQRSLLL